MKIDGQNASSDQIQEDTFFSPFLDAEDEKLIEIIVSPFQIDEIVLQPFVFHDDIVIVKEKFVQGFVTAPICNEICDVCELFQEGHVEHNLISEAKIIEEQFSQLVHMEPLNKDTVYDNYELVAWEASKFSISENSYQQFHESIKLIFVKTQNQSMTAMEQYLYTALEFFVRSIVLLNFLQSRKSGSSLRYPSMFFMTQWLSTWSWYGIIDLAFLTP